MSCSPGWCARRVGQQLCLTPNIPYAAYKAFLRSYGFTPLRRRGVLLRFGQFDFSGSLKPGLWHLQLLYRISDQTNQWRWVRVVDWTTRLEIRSERPDSVSRLDELQKKVEILKQLRFWESHDDLPDVKISSALSVGAAL